VINRNRIVSLLVALVALTAPFAAQAQSAIAEDFTQASATNPWWFFNGACLTAGGATGTEPSSGAGQLPGCTTIAASYYDKSSNEVLVGGYNGSFPDPVGKGALRFTNGYPYGYHENGGIVSTTPFPTGQGVAITFKTVTYLGDSGGNGKDGADGISFYLMDASQLNTSIITGQSSGNGNGLGAWGGSLGYSCSNSNSPYNGLIGGYLGVGIDEYGNFLNGTTNTLGETGTTAGGDNTASGGGYQPGRIGLRGAGSIAWNSLNNAYGSNPNNTAAPYYPSSLLTSCFISGGAYNASTGGCMSCSAGTYTSSNNTCVTTLCTTGAYNATTGMCEACPTGDTYNSSGNTCITQTCASGTYDSTTGQCESCPTGDTYNATSNSCVTTVCASGVYNSSTGQCESCPTGDTYNSTTNTCLTQTCSTGTYNSGTGKCETCSSGTYNSTANKCEVCATGTYSASTGECEICASGYTYNSGSGECTKGALNATPTTSTPTANTPGASSPTTVASTASSTNTVTPTASATNTLSPTASATQTPTPTQAQTDWYSAVQNTCRNGTLYNYSAPAAPTNAGATSLSNAMNTAGLLDYGALPGGYVVLPSGTQIAAESATTRAGATPIYYQLKISQNGLLSLSYSICPSTGCGAWQAVLTKQNITTANGPLPANFLFGFAGSTGGSSNIHEILCFQAAPATSAASSAGASEKQSAKLETGVQAYFAYYNPNEGWTGDVTASSLAFDQYGNVIIASVPNWDSSCVLTGVASGYNCTTTGVAGPTAAEPPLSPGSIGSRQIITWNGTTGVAFEWGSLTATQQAALTQGDASPTADRTNFLRGDRTNEINSAGTGEFRRRTSVLADIIDSSPTWVGSPGSPYAMTWLDRLHSTATVPEAATTAQTYAQYMAAEANRTQVVYVGANDGLLHGFRSGTYNSTSGTCASTPSQSCFTNNDGLEVIAYMPGATISGTSNQLIHPNINNVSNIPIDYANAQYGHNYFVNAQPGSGDLFFAGQWHTWLAGGLGSGGAAIYALDITNPSNFLETNASSIVLGEWNNATISCVGNTGCGTSMGNTYGTPQIRRLHDGRWGIIFGNGLGSATGDAGIFIITIDPNQGASAAQVWYLSTKTGSPTSPNGIAFATPVDLDGDQIVDYVYAGDIQGNVWRFDLTSASEGSWGLTPGPLFKTGGLPITTQVVVASGSPNPGMEQMLMVLFGTGQKIGFTNTSGSIYASGTQNLYGVWDWNLSSSDGGIGGAGAGGGWDGISSAQYASLSRAAAGLTTLTSANLQLQTVTINSATGDRDINANATICWDGQGVTCPQGALTNAFGWYLNLPGGQEQVIYSPELVAQALTVNTIVPAVNSPISCTNNSDTGFTYVLSALTGAAFNQVFLPPSEAANPAVAAQAAYQDVHAIGIQTNATGSSFITGNSAGTQYLVYETNQVQSGITSSGASNNILGGALGLNLPPNTTGRRLGWIELR
jgi:type IV pilus assembly protein PilY1